MDPDANWQEQLEIASRIQHSQGFEEGHPERVFDAGDAERLSELILALDEWAKRGGFPPRVFQPKK